MGGIILASAGLGFARLRAPRPSETLALAPAEADERPRSDVKSPVGRARSAPRSGTQPGGPDPKTPLDAAQLSPNEPLEASRPERSGVVFTDPPTPSEHPGAPAQEAAGNAESLFLERHAPPEDGADSFVRALEILRARRAASDEGDEGATVERSLEALLQDHRASLDRLGVGSESAASSPDAAALVRDFMALQGLPEAARTAKLEELAARFQLSSPSLPEIPPSSQTPSP